MAERIKILHIVKNLTVGGLERVVVNICNGLDRSVFEPSIVMLTNEDDTMAKDLAPNVKVYTLPFAYKENIRIGTLYKQYKSLGKLLKELQPDIVHAHIYATRLFILARACKKYSPKTQLIKTEHLHGIHYESAKFTDKIKIKIEQRAYKLLPSYLVGISKPIDRNNKRHFSKYIRHFFLVNNGIDSHTFSKNKVQVEKKQLGFRNDELIVVHVGRFAAVKNHKTILKAWEVVQNRNLSAKLVLIGDGSERNHIEQQIKELGLGESVILTGNISNVPDYLSVADIALLPSLLEGFPLVMLEEMYMKLPIIVSDIDVFTSILTDGVNGLIVPTFDAEKLAAAIIRLLNNEDERKRIGEAGYCFVEKEYTLEKMVDGYESCYRYIYNNKSST